MAEGLDSLDGPTLTLGAFMAGGMISVGLSAVVGFQTFLYFQMFPKDTLRYKLLVAWIWFVDAGHTILVCLTIWQYAVLNFNNPAILLEIAPAFSASALFTFAATLNANLFYTRRIHKMSKNNWWLSGPICVLCITRTALGLFSSAEMLITKSWSIMGEKYKSSIVGGMAVSVGTDIVISAARYYYLYDLKQGYMATPEMVDAIVIFTINDGLLTCVTLIASITCFLAMPKNFIWIGFYIIVSKLFANSVLTTLNLRNWYRHRHRPMGIRLTRQQADRNTLQIGHGSSADKIQSTDMHEMPTTMEVFMDQQVEYNVPVDKYIGDYRETHSRP